MIWYVNVRLFEWNRDDAHLWLVSIWLEKHDDLPKDWNAAHKINTVIQVRGITYTIRNTLCDDDKCLRKIAHHVRRIPVCKRKLKRMPARPTGHRQTQHLYNNHKNASAPIYCIRQWARDRYRFWRNNVAETLEVNSVLYSRKYVGYDIAHLQHHK